MNDFNLLFQIMQTETLETPTSITEMIELFLQRLYFCSPVLTSVATKNGMAIIKIGREALFHLQRIVKVNGDDAKNCSRRNKDKLITASTNVFKLKPETATYQQFLRDLYSLVNTIQSFFTDINTYCINSRTNLMCKQLSFSLTLLV